MALLKKVVPGVGNLKSLIEAISGKDYVTGAEFTKLERWLSAFGAVAPGVKAAVGLIKGGGKGLAKLGTVASKGGDNASNIAKNLADGGVYVLKEKEMGDVVRVGRTNNLKRRKYEHAKDSQLDQYEFDPVYPTNDYPTQRGLEQQLYDQHQPMYNKIRPISSKNKRYQEYMDAAKTFPKK